MAERPASLESQTGARGVRTGPDDEAARAAAKIDELMEKASQDLAQRRYFESAARSWNALFMARRIADLERMARITMPLQEARRQIREIACEQGPAVLVRGPEDLPQPFRAGCYLVQPPMIGADGRALRLTAEKRKIEAFVLTREPMTRKGLWPLVGVGVVSTRAQVKPPVELERVEDRMTKDAFDGPIPIEWFVAAGEALGDAAIAKLDPEHSPWWHVDDLLEALDAVPEHEKLHQRLERACREAMVAPIPDEPRPGPHYDPTSF